MWRGKDCTVQEELSRDIRNMLINLQETGCAGVTQPHANQNNSAKWKHHGEVVSGNETNKAAWSAGWGAADGGRGALKVFPFTWRPRTFYSSGNKPLIVVYSEKGNHLWNRACYFPAQSVNPKQAGRQLHRLHLSAGWILMAGWREGARGAVRGRERLTAGPDMGIKSCPEESSIHGLLTAALSSRPGHFLCLLTTLEQN